MSAETGPDARGVDADGTERLSPDDEAQRTAAAFVAAALYRQRLRAQRTPLRVHGLCSNCGARCLPAAVYCDADCRTDHEARERARLRGAVA